MTDSLYIVSAGTTSEFSTFFFHQLAAVCTKPAFQYLPGEGHTSDYFSAQNKYFSSKIKPQFITIDSLVENLKAHQRPDNYFVVFDGLGSWEDAKQNPRIATFLRLSDQFRALIFEDSFFNSVKINDFYEQIGTFIPAFSISFDPEADNTGVTEELEEMLANHTWKTEYKKNDPSSKEGEGKVEKKSKEDFMAMFDVISEFKNQSKDLSPTAKKNKACDIMQQLLENFDFSDEDEQLQEAADTPPTDPSAHGYQKV
jgi:hypothetical protein